MNKAVHRLQKKITIIFVLFVVLADYRNVPAQTEAMFITNPAFVSKENRPAYYTISGILEIKKSGPDFHTPTIITMASDNSFEVYLASLIHHYPDTSALPGYKPPAYRLGLGENRLTIYEKGREKTDSTFYFYNRDRRVDSIRSSYRIWHYDIAKKDGYVMDYQIGKCYYDAQSRLLKLEETYQTPDGLSVLHVHWHCYYETNLRYYLKYESFIKQGPYRLTGIFLLDYSSSPDSPTKSELKKPFKTILAKTPRFISP